MRAFIEGEGVFSLRGGFKAPEAVVQDVSLGASWLTAGLDGKSDLALVFVRGEVVGCMSSSWGNAGGTTLFVRDPGYAGTSVDLDGDGVAEIVWTQ